MAIQIEEYCYGKHVVLLIRICFLKKLKQFNPLLYIPLWAPSTIYLVAKYNALPLVKTQTI